uniref:Uncharacterized protein n=1 Tax=Oryza rufipogon TaxID=4529 RepID=A0A0E0PIT5_ORYRU
MHITTNRKMTSIRNVHINKRSRCHSTYPVEVKVGIHLRLASYPALALSGHAQRTPNSRGPPPAS